MKKATFSEGVGVALISSVSVAALFTVLSSVMFSGDLFRLLIAGISFFYILYLFLRSKERIGRISLVVIWFVVTLASMIFVPSLFLYISIQLLMIWLLRCLYFYNSIFSALIDLALTSMSLVIAIWSWSVSGSLFLAFWCFFLVQALFVYIPKNFNNKKESKSSNQGAMGNMDNMSEMDKFEHAYHAAEMAVSKIINS